MKKAVTLIQILIISTILLNPSVTLGHSGPDSVGVNLGSECKMDENGEALCDTTIHDRNGMLREMEDMIMNSDEDHERMEQLMVRWKNMNISDSEKEELSKYASEYPQVFSSMMSRYIMEDFNHRLSEMQPYGVNEKEMYNRFNMMSGMGGTFWMAIGWIFILLFLYLMVLTIMSLHKYLNEGGKSCKKCQNNKNDQQSELGSKE